MSLQDTLRRLSPFAFLDWWSKELAGLLPGVLKRGLGRGGRVLVLDRREGLLIASRRSGNRERETARIDLRRGSASERQQFGRLLSRAARRAGETVLRLPPSDVLERHLDLPAVAEGDLRNALYFEIDRQTPFRPSEIYFGFAVSGRRPDGKRLDVDLTVVPRKVVDNATASLREWQIVPDVIEVETGPGLPPTRVPLHQEDATETGFVRGNPFNWLLAAAVVAGVAAALYLPLEYRRQEAEALAAEVNEARGRADAATATRKEIDDLLYSRQGLQERKLSAPSAVAILDELSRLLPDEVWIANLQIDGREVRLTGYATTAASLIGLIDASPSFQTPRFLSPVTQDSRYAKERFSLSVELEPVGEK